MTHKCLITETNDYRRSSRWTSVVEQTTTRAKSQAASGKEWYQDGTRSRRGTDESLMSAEYVENNTMYFIIFFIHWRNCCTATLETFDKSIIISSFGPVTKLLFLTCLESGNCMKAPWKMDFTTCLLYKGDHKSCSLWPQAFLLARLPNFSKRKCCVKWYASCDGSMWGSHWG